MNQITQHSSRLLTRLAAPVVAALAISACATSGIGTGGTPNNNVSATFAWKSFDDLTGTLTSTLNNGETFMGKFFQITSETRVEELAPLWDGWHSAWSGWNYWDRTPSEAFVTNYSGTVVANLDGPNAEHMRCRFVLVRPESGMAGGGEGKCQLPSGENIYATFPSV